MMMYSEPTSPMMRGENRLPQNHWQKRWCYAILLPWKPHAYLLFTAGIYCVQILWLILWDVFVGNDLGRNIWFAISIPMWIWDVESIRCIIAAFMRNIEHIRAEEDRVIGHSNQNFRQTPANLKDLKRIEETTAMYEAQNQKQVLSATIKTSVLACIVAIQILGIWKMADVHAFGFWAFLIPALCLFTILWLLMAIKLILRRAKTNATQTVV